MNRTALPLRLGASLAVALAFFVGSRASAQAPGAKPNVPPLARYVPKDDLIAYLEFDGLDSVPWKGSALYKVLNETKAGALLEDLSLIHI